MQGMTSATESIIGTMLHRTPAVHTQMAKSPSQPADGVSCCTPACSACAGDALLACTNLRPALLHAMPDRGVIAAAYMPGHVAASQRR